MSGRVPARSFERLGAPAHGPSPLVRSRSLADPRHPPGRGSLYGRDGRGGGRRNGDVPRERRDRHFPQDISAEQPSGRQRRPVRPHLGPGPARPDADRRQRRGTGRASTRGGVGCDAGPGLGGGQGRRGVSQGRGGRGSRGVLLALGPGEPGHLAPNDRRLGQTSTGRRPRTTPWLSVAGGATWSTSSPPRGTRRGWRPRYGGETVER